jgi:hypothetical protein
MSDVKLTVKIAGDIEYESIISHEINAEVREQLTDLIIGNMKDAGNPDEVSLIYYTKEAYKRRRFTKTEDPIKYTGNNENKSSTIIINKPELKGKKEAHSIDELLKYVRMILSNNGIPETLEINYRT